MPEATPTDISSDEEEEERVDPSYIPPKELQKSSDSSSNDGDGEE